MQTTKSPQAGERTQDGFEDIFQQGFNFEARLIQGASQQFNTGSSNIPKCPYITGSSMHREWMNGVRFAEKQFNFVTGI